MVAPQHSLRAWHACGPVPKRVQCLAVVMLSHSVMHWHGTLGLHSHMCAAPVSSSSSPEYNGPSSGWLVGACAVLRVHFVHV